ncbi:unnamed protein product [Closterium sp. NIES-53]
MTRRLRSGRSEMLLDEAYPVFPVLFLTFLTYSEQLFVESSSAMTNEVIWLIVISFFFARGFVKTGLGDRVATYFVKWFGKSTLGLSYGLAGAFSAGIVLALAK